MPVATQPSMSPARQLATQPSIPVVTQPSMSFAGQLATQPSTSLAGQLVKQPSIPVVTLLELSIREPAPMLFVHALVVAGVGTCSAVIFDRTMARLEGPGLFHWVWMAVFGVLFLEIGWFMSLFSL
jgi:hypothetical protein